MRDMNKVLTDIIKRAENWPKERQEELAFFVTQIEEGLKGGVYHATAEELEAIDEGLKGKAVSKKKVDALFAKFRRGNT